MFRRTVLIVALTSLSPFVPRCVADPCGMVPPIYQGSGTPISRIGEQITYVFYKDGVESLVIRPGFQGMVEQFGMLIPFPTPPAIRKVPDDIFTHVANAVDPPEVVINLLPKSWAAFSRFGARPDAGLMVEKLSAQEVHVLREEAVGMYEVAVLEAGSSEALKRWMDDHGFRYPQGMDNVCDDYVADGWCFVAVKTKVGPKAGVDPEPGQREVSAQLPTGSVFDGHVQAMGFRFKSNRLVVPMRLSAFNDGQLRNIVYLLTDGPKRINRIPSEFVVRQMPGSQLRGHLSNPLPLRIIGGTEANLTPWHRKSLPEQRDPRKVNGAARELFAADLHAVFTKQLSLAHEDREKELLRIGERLGLRGAEIDKLHNAALAAAMDETLETALAGIDDMTLTVVDGDFPRDVLARHNLVRSKPTAFGRATLKGSADPT